jgi:hypothetical protein
VVVAVAIAAVRTAVANFCAQTPKKKNQSLALTKKSKKSTCAINDKKMVHID